MCVISLQFWGFRLLRLDRLDTLRSLPVGPQLLAQFLHPCLHHLQAFRLQGDQLVHGFHEVPWVDFDLWRFRFHGQVEENHPLLPNQSVHVDGRVPGHLFLEELEAGKSLARPVFADAYVAGANLPCS